MAFKKKTSKTITLSKEELGVLSKELELLENTLAQFTGRTERFLLFRKLKKVFKQAST
tara:strand:- start:11913 stop:12086 length:174 start_codon:yes stop_codon:yes gene_type:complete